ncbi:MAG TPA: hypothetical protein VHM70_04330 [Polyangiaceae bacterium]|nr:hypothetical protein [Polyangiaceae bacterium]
MGIDLARHLVAAGIAPRAKVEAALLRQVGQGEPFLFVLTQHDPSLLEPIERELLRLAGPSFTAPPSHEFMQRLPQGLAARLLAYPIGRPSSQSDVDVLAADPLDAQVAIEFSFHLGRPVRVVPGPLTEVVAALERWSGDFGAPLTLRQDGEYMNQPIDSRVAFETLPPIPLVRRPPVGSQPAPSSPGSEQRQANLDQRRIAKERLELALSELATADSAEQVALTMAVAMGTVAEEAVVFGLRAGRLSSRVRLNHTGKPERFVDLEIEPGFACSLTRALEAGQYVGAPTPEDLLLLVGQPSLVCATRVMVQERAGLGFLVGGFADSFEVSQVAERVARHAGEALTRIVRLKKR